MKDFGGLKKPVSRKLTRNVGLLVWYLGLELGDNDLSAQGQRIGESNQGGHFNLPMERKRLVALWQTLGRLAVNNARPTKAFAAWVEAHAKKLPLQ